MRYDSKYRIRTKQLNDFGIIKNREKRQLICVKGKQKTILTDHQGGGGDLGTSSWEKEKTRQNQT